jgi:hypothetical protein
LNKQLAEIDVDKLQALLKRELKRHAERSPKSQALLVNAKKVMPSGVPMAWMSGYYEAPPVFVVIAIFDYLKISCSVSLAGPGAIESLLWRKQAISKIDTAPVCCIIHGPLAKK